MWQIIGWVIWGILVFLAISFAVSCRIYAKSGKEFQWATGVQTLFFWIIAILFFMFGWDKLHILWLVAVTFFAAPVLVLGRVPLLSPLVLFITKIFISIILIGVKKSQ